MVVENFTIADVRTLGNAFTVNEARKWKSDFFKEKVTSDCQKKLRKKRLISYYNAQTGKVARTALFSRGATGVVCLLEDAKGERDKYVLKLYERLDENFVEKQGIISKTIKDWGNKGIRKYFVDYSYYSQAFQDWSDEEKLGSFLVMEQVQNSKPLAAKYISDLRNQKSTDEFQSILGGIVKEYVNLMKVLSKENVGFGDLAGDNLLVSEKINEHDGTVTYTLKLVDYDDMYVPGISGFSVEAGKPGFQHKTRVVGWKLTSTIHHFSSLVYYVSLLICLKDWEFAKNYLSKNYADTQTWNILFKGEDLLYPGSSSLFENIRNHKDKEINFFSEKLYEWACADSVENMPSLPDFIREFETSKHKSNPEPVPTPEPIGNTEIPIQPRDADSNRSGSNKKEVPISPREEELGADELCALGDKYYEGDGVQKDYKKAVEYYTKAAEKGYAEAQYSLALMYYDGEGVKQNHKKAIEWFKKAAEQGHTEAEEQLALINKENQPARETPRPPVTTVPDTYTVIYDGNGALDGRMKQETHTCGETRKLLKNHFTRTGYKFLGWAKTPDGGRKYDDGEEVRDLGDKNSTVTLYAHWKPIEYKINYVGNGADGNDTLRSIHTYNEEMRLAANIFTRKGYKFLGWATSPSYPVTYRDEEVVINLSNTDNATVNLYAVWDKELIKYTVVYDGNGAAEGSMKRETYIQDEVRKLPTNRFVRPGYKFVGWAKTPNGGVRYDDGEVVRNIANGNSVVTLYAQWEPVRYKVYYRPNGADIQDKILSSTHTYGVPTPLARNIYTRRGYKFLGWSKVRDGQVAFTDEQLLTEDLIDKEYDVALFAVWEKIETNPRPTTYTVNFDGNGATEGKMLPAEYTVGISHKLRSNHFSRPGYKFTGWAKSPSGPIIYENEALVSNLVTIGDSITLYAQWKPIQYKVNYQPNGADNMSETFSSTHTYGKPTPLAKNTYHRKGYTFLGWSKIRDGPVVFTDGQLLTEDLRDKEYDISLFAVWKKIDSDKRELTHDKISSKPIKPDSLVDIQQNHRKYIDEQIIAAKQGDVSAQKFIGHVYGQLEQKPEEAIKFYLNAGDLTHPEIQCDLGRLYEMIAKSASFYSERKNNYLKAVEWYTKAAEQGLADAQFLLGSCYELGRGVEIDINKAIKWYKKAAEQGDKSSQDSLYYLESRLKRNNPLVRLKKLFSKK